MDTYGPPVPPSFASNHQNKDEEEDFAIGPTPPGTSAPHRHYEKPSFSKDTEDSNKREEWMLSLPDMKKKTQLSHLQGSLPTNFRKNAVAPQDDSWTKNPNEPDSHSPKKKKKRSRSRDDFDDAYDREQEKAAKSSKKDRDRDKKSLLELHKAKLKKEKKKLKKERKEKDEKPERKPFSRDTDLSWNSNDSKKKSKAIDNMSKPDSRFHSGSRKYL